jgi:hypothetical protein
MTLFAKQWHNLILRIAHKKMQFWLTYIEPVQEEQTEGHSIVLEISSKERLMLKCLT